MALAQLLGGSSKRSVSALFGAGVTVLDIAGKYTGGGSGRRHAGERPNVRERGRPSGTANADRPEISGARTGRSLSRGPAKAAPSTGASALERA